MCYKQLEKFDEAEKYYNDLRKQIKEDTEQKRARRLIFGLLFFPRFMSPCTMIPHLDAIDEAAAARTKRHVAAEPLRGLLTRFYSDSEGWRTDAKSEAITLLHKQPFFRRFNSSQLAQILKLIKVRMQPPDSFLFLPKNEVAVILQGDVMVYSHTAQLSKPQAVAQYGPGDILGYAADGGVSRHPENWSRSVAGLELCLFSYTDFDVTTVV